MVISNEITKDIVVKVKKEDVKVSQTPYVFKGDKGITFQLTIENWNYYFSKDPTAEVDQFTDCTAKIQIVQPDESLAKLINVPIENNEIQFKVNKNLSSMVGDYRVYVEILRDNFVVATVPPFTYKVLDKPDFSKVLPVDIGYIKAGVEDENILAYSTTDDYGIKTISQLPNADDYEETDELLLETNGLSKKLAIGKITEKYNTAINEKSTQLENELRQEINDKHSQSTTYTDEEIVKAKSYTDEKLVEGKGYTDQKIKDVVGLAPPELDTLKEIGDYAKENKELIDGFLAQLLNKSDKDHVHEVASDSKNGFMSIENFVKLKGIAEGANNYTHPKTHQASIIVQDSTHRFVSDEDKSKWTDTKIDNVSIEGQEMVFKAENVEKFRLQLPKGFSGSYNDLTDKPQPYELPIATDTTLGGIKLGIGFEKLEDGTVNVTSSKAESVEWEGILNKPQTFTPPIATADMLGGIKVGDGLAVSVDGTLSADVKEISWEGIQGKPTEFKPTIATSTVVGGVKAGTTVNIGEDGTLNVVQTQLTPEWEKINGKPSTFTPTTHKHTKSEITDMFSVENSLTSNSSTNALSVAQGKKIDDKVTSLNTTVEELVGAKHTHSNKADLDKITNAKITSWDNKAEESHKHTKADITDMFNVVNSLTSTSTTDALSANQGKLLKDRIDTLEQSAEGIHSHANKLTLDKITEEKLTEWDSKETVEGSQAKANKSLQDAKDYVDSKVMIREAYTRVIQTSDFGSLANGVYKTTVSHNLDTNKILISFIDNTTKENVLVSYKIVDSNSIEITSTTNAPIEVTIVDATLSVPTSDGSSGNVDYKNYRIEYNSVKDSLDFVYSPVS